MSPWDNVILLVQHVSVTKFVSFSLPAAPEAPDGSKWERNLPPPPHVCPGEEIKVWVTEIVELSSIGIGDDS